MMVNDDAREVMPSLPMTEIFSMSPVLNSHSSHSIVVLTTIGRREGTESLIFLPWVCELSVMQNYLG